MSIPVIDLHCDLLAYLTYQPHRSPQEDVSRCSLKQMQEGHVKMQVLAVFTQTTPEALSQAKRQLEEYQNLPLHYPQAIKPFASPIALNSSQIQILFAFENASGFCDEQEPFMQGMQRLEQIIQEKGKPLYIGLTWNSENRFGGGASTTKGLKEDGKRLLEYLHGKGIAIDFSHTSDALANEIFDYMERNQLVLPVLASHSNMRAIKEVPRNLSLSICREIFKRKGVVGLNLFRPFIGEKEEDLVKHVAYALEQGGEQALVFGADFFYEVDFPSTARHNPPIFFEAYGNSSCYGRLLNLLQKELRLKEPEIERLAYRNALEFIQNQIIVKM